MVYISSYHGVHVSGDKSRIQVKAHVLHGHVLVFKPAVFHHRLYEYLVVRRSGIAENLSLKVGRRIYIALPERHNDVERVLNDRADDFDGYALIGHCRDRVCLIIKSCVSLSGRRQRYGVVGVGGEAHVDVEPLLGVIALFHRHIYEGVNGVGIPVKNKLEILKLSGLSRLRCFCRFSCFSRFRAFR